MNIEDYRMIRTNLALMCILTLLISGLNGCKPQQQSSNENARQEGKGSLQQTPPSFNRVFVGNIEGKGAIRMMLKRDGEKLSGYYRKTATDLSLGDYVSLEGELSDDGEFSIEEFDSPGNDQATAIFKGKLINATTGGGQILKLEGTWSKTDGGMAVPASLTEELFDLGSNLWLVSRDKKEESKKPGYTIEAMFPQIEGSGDARAQKFNQEINNILAREIEEFKASNKDDSDPPPDPDLPGSYLDISYEVESTSGGLISIAFGVSTYYSGAAHPNSYTLVFNYDIKNGKQLALSDLFISGSNYLEITSAYCIRRLKEKLGDGDWIEEGASAKPDNYKSWNVTPRGLLITFDPYQVASYADGPQEATVPYSELKAVIAPEGLLAQFIK